MGTSIKVRVIAGTHATFLGDFETVEEALAACRPNNVMGFLQEHHGPTKEIEQEGVKLAGLSYSPEMIRHA